MSTFIDPFGDDPPAPRPKGRAKPPAPSPQPPTAPASSPSPSGPASHRLAVLRHPAFAFVGGIVATVAVMVALILASAWVERGPAPEPKVDGVKLGRAFVRPLAASLADGFDAYADALHSGKSAAESDKALKDTFHTSRAKAFKDHAGAALTSIVADGAEPKDDGERAAIEKFHRDFAKGLRSR